MLTAVPTVPRLQPNSWFSGSRRMPGVDLIERRGETDARLARRILGSA